MAKPKLGEYGYNPYDTSPEVPSVPSGTATMPNVGDMAGPMPYGYGSPTYGEDIGNPFDLTTGTAVPSSKDIWTKAQGLQGNELRNYWMTDPYAKKEYNWTDDNAYLSTLYGKTAGVPDRLNEQGLATKYGLEWITPTQGNPWVQPPPPVETTTPPPSGDTATPPPSGDTATPPPSGSDYKTPYGDPVKYVTPYTKDYWNEARQVYQSNLQSSLNPSMEKAAAMARETGYSRGGGGLVSEQQRPVYEEYARQMGQGMNTFEQARLSSDISEAGKASDFNLNEKLAERAWNRTQSSEALGRNYTNKQNDYDAQREYTYWNKKNEVTQKYNDKTMDKQRAFELVDQANQERIQNLQNQFASIEAEKQRAFAAGQQEKADALTREGWQVQKDISDAQNDAAQDSAMWSGLGSLVGTVAGGIMTGGASTLGGAIGTRIKNIFS